MADMASKNEKQYETMLRVGVSPAAVEQKKAMDQVNPHGKSEATFHTMVKAGVPEGAIAQAKALARS